MSQGALGILAWYAYLACLIYLTALAVVFTIMVVVAARENRLRALESRLEDYDTLLASPFTIPVSVIVPAYNEESCVSAAVQSLLALDYPEYEIIVVNDGSTDGTLACLRDRFQLEATGTFYRRTLASAEVRHIYRSRRHPHLTVVSKPNGGKADALNCGINLAQYRYICCVDADTVYQRDALLKGMRLVMQDPATVVGITSRITLSSHPERALQANGTQPRADHHLLMAYQAFDYLRAFMNARLAWSRGNYMLCSIGAFAIWRKDVVLELGGFSSRFTCEDIEFTFRVHEHFRARGIAYRIHALSDPVGVTEGPTSIGGLVSQRARWQRVIAETVWHYRRMLCNPRYGSVGLVGMPYYLVGEALAPVFQLTAVLAIPLAAAGGVLQWDELAQILAIIALGSAIFTALAMALHDQSARPFAARDLAYMVLLSPLELLLYRPIIFFAQFKGTIDFLRGDRAWHKFERNRR